MNLVSHDVSVGSFGVAAAVVDVEIVVFVVAYTFTTSNQRRNIKATDTATSVSAAVDLEVIPSAVVLSCCWNNSRNNTKSLKFYHNVVINSRQFERLIFGYRTCLNSG